MYENLDGLRDLLPIKKCGRCDKEKLLVEFPPHRTAFLGVSAWCNTCHYRYRRQHPQRSYPMTAEALEIRRAKQRDYRRKRKEHKSLAQAGRVERLMAMVDKKELTEQREKWQHYGFTGNPIRGTKLG